MYTHTHTHTHTRMPTPTGNTSSPRNTVVLFGDGPKGPWRELCEVHVRITKRTQRLALPAKTV
jgi:hypothetical protein